MSPKKHLISTRPKHKQIGFAFDGQEETGNILMSEHIFALAKDENEAIGKVKLLTLRPYTSYLQRPPLWLIYDNRSLLYFFFIPWIYTRNANTLTSSESFLQSGAAAERMMAAVAVLPVKLTRRISGCETRACPALGPVPKTMFTTPGGTPQRQRKHPSIIHRSTKASTATQSTPKVLSCI